MYILHIFILKTNIKYRKCNRNKMDKKFGYFFMEDK